MAAECRPPVPLRPTTGFPSPPGRSSLLPLLWALRFASWSPSVGNPMFRHDETSRAQRRCLTHHLPETSLVPILPARVPRTATLSQVQKGSGFKRSARGRVLPSSVIEVRAILPSPYCAELAGLKLQRFGFFARFLSMLLFPPPFGVRLAGVPRTSLKF